MRTSPGQLGTSAFAPRVVARAALLVSLFVAGASDVCALTTPPERKVVLLHIPEDAYSGAIEAFRDGLRRSGVPVVEIALEEGSEPKAVASDIARERPTVVVTTGPVTARLALAATTDALVISMMTPNAADMLAEIEEPAQRARLHIVTSDVAPDRQIAFVKAVQRSPNCLAVLHSGRTRRTAGTIARAAQRAGIRARLIPASRDEFLSAIDVLNESMCDIVLMIPDIGVYNSAAVRRLMIWGARRRSAVMAFSPKIVRAGAFGGNFVDGREVGEAAAALVESAIRGDDLSTVRIHYIDNVVMALNERMAETIGTTIDESKLTGRLIRFAEDE